MQENYPNGDEIGINLKELLFELLAHWKLLMLSTVLAGAAAFAASVSLVVPQYESTAELYVLSKSTSITSLADIQMGTNLTNDYMVVVKGRPVLEQVIKNLGLAEDYRGLSEKITLYNPTDSRILEITVRDPKPERARQVADEMAQVASAFISEKMDQDPPTIIQHGYADGEPVSPNILKNTLIGLLAGGVLAVAVVVVSSMLNDTVMDADDVERRLGLNLLGTLPLEEEGDSGKKKRGVFRRIGKNKKQHDGH